MLIAIGALILIIAIINYVNLATVRSSSRVKEIGVRKVIGSGKGNIAGMFMTEAVLVNHDCCLYLCVYCKIRTAFSEPAYRKIFKHFQFWYCTNLHCALIVFCNNGCCCGYLPILVPGKF